MEIQDLNNTTRRLFTVRQFARRHAAFSEGGLRWLIFNAKGRKSSKEAIAPNGLEAALVRVGRRVLIDEHAFFGWLDAQQTGTGDTPIEQERAR